jgi:thiol-disulfide isomerase/thioredoxin
VGKKIELVLYSKPDCPLCDEMKEVVEEVSAQIPLTLSTVDITGVPDLEEKFGLDIPLLFHGENRIGKHRIHNKVLFRKLQKLSGAKKGRADRR